MCVRVCVRAYVRKQMSAVSTMQWWPHVMDVAMLVVMVHTFTLHGPRVVQQGQVDKRRFSPIQFCSFARRTQCE